MQDFLLLLGPHPPVPYVVSGSCASVLLEAGVAFEIRRQSRQYHRPRTHSKNVNVAGEYYIRTNLHRLRIGISVVYRSPTLRAYASTG